MKGLIASIVLTSACTMLGQTTQAPVLAPAAGSVPVSGGCEGSQAFLGKLDGVRSTGEGAPDLPYVVARPNIAAVFLFAAPLEPKGTKLTVVVTDNSADAMTIEATPFGREQPRFNSRLDKNGRGDYGGILAVGGPGCWHVQLRWADKAAEMELAFNGP